MTRLPRLTKAMTVLGDVLMLASILWLATAVTLAIQDYHEREAERLEHAHADGMALGASMCGKDRP